MKKDQTDTENFLRERIVEGWMDGISIELKVQLSKWNGIGKYLIEFLCKLVGGE